MNGQQACCSLVRTKARLDFRRSLVSGEARARFPNSGWKSSLDKGLSQENLVVGKATLAPSQLMFYFIILADAETTNVRLDCVAGM